jgi:hypothetical protein
MNARLPVMLGLTVSASLSQSSFAADGVALVLEGRATSAIVIAADAHPDEALAAQELQQHLGRISGATVEVLRAKPEEAAASMGQQVGRKAVPVILGSPALSSDLEQAIRARGSDPGSFAVKVDGKSVRIAGLSPEGTLFGVYELLEQLGVRWFMPGDLGTVIPTAKTVTVRVQTTVQVPSFAGRWHTGGARDPWQRRVRMGGPYFPSCHGIKIGKVSVADHPAYFALRNGERNGSQLCLSNPEVLRLAIENVKEFFRKNPDQPWCGMGPNDGGGFCECPNCQALDGGDWDPFSNELSVTDRYVWFLNRVLEGIRDEFPDKKLCFYVYANYMRPPVKAKPDSRICPAFAPISLCRVHGMGNPICPDKSYYRTVMEAWGKLLPEVYERGYWFNLADPGFPFSMVHRMRDEIPTAKKLGIKGWRVETLAHWGSHTPSLYLAAKLMWDCNADVDALLKDFYERFFGPAGTPMGQYCELMDAALRDADHHTGSSWDMPWFYPASLRARADRLLTDAAQVAVGTVYGKRVHVFRDAFDYVTAFIAMREHVATCDFTSARQDLETVDRLREKLLAYDPPMVSKKAAESYLQRFFRRCTEEGYAKTTGGNELVAAFSDEWDFLLDSMKIGDLTGLWRPELKGGNWQRIRTSSSSWSNQGLYYLKGQAWYRQSVGIPAKFKARRLMLWFGGVDETAQVRVNGKDVGTATGAFRPFEFDVTDAAVPGQNNLVVVRIENEALNELGTGGIVEPVMFYAPAGGAGPR